MVTSTKKLRRLLLALILLTVLIPAASLAEEPADPSQDVIPPGSWEAYGESGSDQTELTIRQENWGDPVTMTVTVMSDTYSLQDLGLAYQWSYQTSADPQDWTVLEAATDASYTADCMEAVYRCDITDRSGNTRTVFYTVYEGVPLDGASVTVDTKKSRVYCGRPIRLACTLTLPDGTLLDSRKDTLRITYSPEPVNVGTVTMTIEGYGKYYGSVTGSYKITPAQLSRLDFRYSRSMTYTGKGLYPKLTVIDHTAGQTLKENTDYTLKYKRNRLVGMGEIHIQAKGNYTNSMILLFDILPPKPQLTSVTVGKKKITAKWTKVTTQTSGYQVRAATNKRFSKGKRTATITSVNTTSKTLTKLKAKHKYYVKVRSYKKLGGRYYYSYWSPAKIVYTK